MMHDAITIPVLIPLPPDEAAEAEGHIWRGSKAIPVRAFPDDEWVLDAAWRKKPLNDPRVAKDLLHLWHAMQGQTNPDPMLIQRVRQRVRLAPQQEPRKPERILSEGLSKMLESVKLVLYWSEKEQRFLPAFYCAGGIPGAALVRALLTIVAGEGRGLRVCPHCSKLFLQADPRQDWCSNACGNAARVAEWRAKQKKHSKKASKRNRRH